MLFQGEADARAVHTSASRRLDGSEFAVEVRQLDRAGAGSPGSPGLRRRLLAGAVGLVELLGGALTDTGLFDQAVELILGCHSLLAFHRWIETSLLYHNYEYL